MDSLLVLSYLTLVVITVAGAGVFWLGARELYAWIKPDAIQMFATELKLLKDGEGLKGVRDGVVVVVRPAAQSNKEVRCSISLLDPQGPAGLDFFPEGLGYVEGASGPDMLVGDPAFDDAVHVCSADPWQCLASLPPSTRAVVAGGVGQQWRRRNAEWLLEAVVSQEVLQTEIARGVRMCLALRGGKTSTFDRLRLRMADPVEGVARVATHLMFDKDWIEEDQLSDLMHHADASIAVRAAKAAGAEGKASLTQMLSTGTRDHRILAAVALAMMDDVVPAAVEPLLLRGLETEHGTQCIHALARVGTSAAVQALSAFSGTEQALAQIASRRAGLMGAVSIVDVVGGGVSIVDGPRDG